MEFKDYLKHYRKEKNVSQQALADAIFVSRSAIAKWENGLGLPNEESYQALLAYFSVSEEAFPLHAVSVETVTKNPTIYWLWRGIALTLALLLAVLCVSLYYALQNGFGFTSRMAAGKYWADEFCIQTPEYDFYCTFYATDEDPQFMIAGIRAVKKELLGYQRVDLSEYAHDLEGKYTGTVYSFPGENGYYHFVFPTIILQLGGGGRLPLIEEIRIKEEVFEVRYHRFFKSNFELYEFYVGEDQYKVKS